MSKGTCSIDDCTAQVGSRGMCNKHYLRQRLTGRTDLLPWRERFWRHVNKDGPVPAGRTDLGPCWVWLSGTVRGGYGRFACATPLDSKMAHRISYELIRGRIPEGLQLDHLCRNRRCVNPGHLEPVTGHLNILRGESYAAVNARKTHCIHGHEFTASNTYTPPKRPDRRYCRQCIRDADRRRTARLRASL